MNIWNIYYLWFSSYKQESGSLMPCNSEEGTKTWSLMLSKKKSFCRCDCQTDFNVTPRFPGWDNELFEGCGTSEHTWTPGVEEQHKLAQDFGRDLVPNKDLELEFVSSDDSIGWAEDGEVEAARLTGLLGCTPATGILLRKGKYGLGLLGFCWRWPCNREWMSWGWWFVRGELCLGSRTRMTCSAARP